MSWFTACGWWAQAHGARVDHCTRDGVTPLVAAVRDNRKEVVRLLLQHGAVPEQPLLDTGKTAVDVAQDKVRVRGGKAVFGSHAAAQRSRRTDTSARHAGPENRH